MTSEKSALTWIRERALDRITFGRPHKFYRVRFGTGQYQGEIMRDPIHHKHAVEDEANIISSELDDGSGLHSPALDIDVPMRVIESSTAGHSHLFWDVPMTWEQYTKLLDVMAEVGILEPGYVEVSKKRRGTHLRTPWVRKGDHGTGPDPIGNSPGETPDDQRYAIPVSW